MVCVTEPAVGASHSWTVLVAGQQSAKSLKLTKHRIPVLSVISGAGLYGGGTEGGTTVSIVGDQLGPIPPRNDKGDYSYRIEANYGRWDVQANAWDTSVVPIFSSTCVMVTAHTSLQCITSPGIGKNLSWAITVHAETAQTSLPNHAEGSYAPPSLYSIQSTKGRDVQQGVTSGGDKIIIDGKNFGPKGMTWNVPTLNYGKVVGVGATEERFNAKSCTVTSDHVRIECNTAEGAGFAHLWEVLVGGQLNTPATTGYSIPEIHNITGAGSTRADTSGNQWVHLHGINFGPPTTGINLLGASFLESVKYGNTGTEYTASECYVVSHVEVRCKTVPGVGTRNLWQIRVAGQVNDVTKSPVTDYDVPRCWSILDVNSNNVDGGDVGIVSTQWSTNPNMATDRIELRCEHTGLGDPTSTRYVRYSLGGYERKILLESDGTRRVGTPGTTGTYEQLRFVNPPLEWINAPSASIPVTVVLKTASNEYLETIPLRHTYGEPMITTEPIVKAGIPGLASTFNVSLSGVNFGERGEVLRYDGECNATTQGTCGTGSVRVCVGGDLKEGDDPVLCSWNVVPGVHQPFNPLVGGVIRYVRKASFARYSFSF
jgi:hypothetical protein